MQAYRLGDGRVLIPMRVDQDGLIGDGYVPVTADSPEAKQWQPWTVDAPDNVDLAERDEQAIHDKAWDTRGRKEHADPEHKARVARARATFVVASADKQAIADNTESTVRQLIGGERTGDNSPFDVTVQVGTSLDAVEVKTLVRNTNDKITMHPESRTRKEEWAEKNGARMHTIVFDRRDEYGQQAGLGANNYSGHRMYYRRGVGAFRLSAMIPVQDATHLHQLMSQ